jgi:hypothetical protein
MVEIAVWLVSTAFVLFVSWLIALVIVAVFMAVFKSSEPERSTSSKEPKNFADGSPNYRWRPE